MLPVSRRLRVCTQLTTLSSCAWAVNCQNTSAIPLYWLVISCIPLLTVRSALPHGRLQQWHGQRLHKLLERLGRWKCSFFAFSVIELLFIRFVFLMEIALFVLSTCDLRSLVPTKVTPPSSFGLLKPNTTSHLGNFSERTFFKLQASASCSSQLS